MENIPYSGTFFIGLDIWTLICVMFFYSFLGWFYESTVFSLVEQGKFMNRGCLVGPYCPIYSVVSVLNLYLLSEVQSSFKIVIISSLTCCVVEYVTSVVLEKLFNARYWDYSYFPLNINGRVSVVSGLFFGFAVLFLIKLVHPFTLIMFGKTSLHFRYYFAIILSGIFILDIVFTTIGMLNLNRKCKELYDAWDKMVEDKLDVLNNKKDNLSKYVVVEKGKNLVVKLKGVNKKFLDFETRYIKNNPAFHSTLYSELIEKMQEALKSKRVWKRKNKNTDTDIDLDNAAGEETEKNPGNKDSRDDD